MNNITLQPTAGITLGGIPSPHEVGTIEHQFLSAIEAAGLNTPDEIIADGLIHRFSTNGRSDDDAGWYVLHNKDVAIGFFGCWREGIQRRWCSHEINQLSQEERTSIQAQVEAHKALLDKEKAQRNALAAEQAARIFESSAECDNHPYLAKKGVKAYGIRQSGDNLIIPLHDAKGTLHSLQIISPDGDKKFLPGGRIKGCFHGMRGTKGILLICEGYATGASLHEATGYQVAVAFNAGNLQTVAQALCDQLPGMRIIVAADDDHKTDGNPGLTKARAAAEAVGGVVAVPDFGANRPEKATDFNDLHMLSGLNAVKRCVEAALTALPAAAINRSVPAMDQDEEVDPHRNVPRPDPGCLYGLVGDIAYAGSQNTEANAYAVAASALAYLSAAVGRIAYMPIGDDFNHARLFFIHVGRSSRGRKGTSKKLIKMIDKTLRARDPALAPQIHSGGLSSREGLVMLIHDGCKDGKLEFPPIDDKRLLVMESEFVNVLQQSKRDGNTLSAALRDAWDGVSIKPAVKNNPVTTTDPHITIMGDVTPSELRDSMHKRELTNGFANRFIFFWAEGGKSVALPPPTPTHVIEGLTDRIEQVLRFVSADQHGVNDVICMVLDPDARILYEQYYFGELRDRSAGERVTGLLDRRAPMLLRLSMLFALTDQTKIIEAQHINAAMAWIRYWVDSVKFIFQSAVDEAGAAVISDVAKRIALYLDHHGQATRTELTKGCFGGHVKKTALDTALDELLTANPPVIEVDTVPRTNGQAGSSTKIYKLCKPASIQAISANSAKPANSAKCAPSDELDAAPGETPAEKAEFDTSLISLTSQPPVEAVSDEEDDVL